MNLPVREKSRGEEEGGGKMGGERKGREIHFSVFLKKCLHMPLPKSSEQKETFSFNNRIVRCCGSKEALHGRHAQCIAVVFQ